MASQPLLKKILTLLEDYIASDDLSPESRLKEDLGLDSMDLVRLVMDINHVFAIQIQSTEIVPEHFASLKTLMDFIHKKQEA